MSYNLSRQLFSVGGIDFTCGDFLKSLEFYGILPQWKDSLRISLLCCEYAEQRNETIDLGIVQEWVSEFRYSMDLLGADEFTAWLNLNNLSRTDFEEFMMRRFWFERYSSNVDDLLSSEPEFGEQQIFSELYFSGSFGNLLKSWQKRLLAWCDSHGGDFPELLKLEDHFSDYCAELSSEMNSSEWLKIREMDLTVYSLDCIVCNSDPQNIFKELVTSQSIDETIEERKLEKFSVEEYHQDLPEEVSKAIKFTLKCGLAGPVEYNGDTLVIRVLKCTNPSISDDEINGTLFDEFSDEVWKTLMVKYVKEN
jgi:hypothetical protein